MSQFSCYFSFSTMRAEAYFSFSCFLLDFSNASFSKDFVRATSTSSQTSNHSRSSSNDSYGSFQFRSAVSLPTVPKYNHNHKARSKQPEDIERMMGGLSVSRD